MRAPAIQARPPEETIDVVSPNAAATAPSFQISDPPAAGHHRNLQPGESAPQRIGHRRPG